MRVHNLLASIFIFTIFVNICRGDEECLNLDEDGTCLEPCPEGTIAYFSDCESITMSQRTCRHPEVRSLGVMCDLARCDCPDSKYWDEAAKKCVTWNGCSDQRRSRSFRRPD